MSLPIVDQIGNGLWLALWATCAIAGMYAAAGGRTAQTDARWGSAWQRLAGVGLALLSVSNLLRIAVDWRVADTATADTLLRAAPLLGLAGAVLLLVSLFWRRPTHTTGDARTEPPLPGAATPVTTRLSHETRERGMLGGDRSSAAEQE